MNYLGLVNWSDQGVKSNLYVLILALCLAGCANDEQPQAEDHSNSMADAITGLVAPPQPRLQIAAHPGSLVLLWQSDSSDTLANVYAYSSISGQETLVAENIPAQNNTLTLPSLSPSRPWQHQQFRVELCSATDCVSSDRMPISWLAGATVQRIAPSVFLQGEHFAESIASNHDGTIVFTTLSLEGAVQVHFRNELQWISSDPIQVAPAYSQSIIDVASSGNGDMLAVLVGATADNAWQASVSIVERLGEAWVVTGAVSIPTSAVVRNTATLTLSKPGDQLLLKTADQVLLYERSALNWIPTQRFTAPSDSHIAAVSVDERFSGVQILLQGNNQLKLFASQLAGNMEMDTNVLMQGWPDSDATLVMGLDADSEVQLQSHQDGTSVIVAGWDTVTLTERSPVLWRYTIGQPDVQTGLSSVDAIDSLRLRPTTDAQARLRFSASHTLDTVLLGWHSAAGDNARLTSFQYDANHMRWFMALELPDALPSLAKQGFAGQVLLAANGETLLIATPAGNATPPHNHVGELLVFR